MIWLKQYGAVIVISFLLLFFICWTAFRENGEPAVTQTAESQTVIKDDTAEKASSATAMYVDVKGAVQHPGIYEINGEERVGDLIEKAGGLTAEANENAINLAQKVQDEMVILVTENSEEGVPAAQSEDGIRVNQADAAELTKLNGIGEAKAEAIIAYREENGPFQTKEDLLEVAGIGEKTLENLQDQLIIP